MRKSPVLERSGFRGTFTQEDPIGLAGGLNLYGFANGDPLNFSDPFGLCKDANGNVLPNDQCRQITAVEGEAVYDAAVASGSWTWTDVIADKDVDSNIGDCTDYVENAMRDAGLPSLGTPANKGAVRTAQFPGDAANPDGDFDVIDGASVRKGDIVVYMGHAGIASGEVDANGRFRTLQNGVSGTGKSWAPAGATIYRRKVPNGTP